MNRIAAHITRQIWPSPSSHKVAERLPVFLRAEALRALGLEGEAVTLDKVETGNITTVRRWVTHARGTLYVRAWPADPIRRPALGHRTASEALTGAGLRVPELVWSEDSFAALRRWRMEVTIEARAPGEPLAGNMGRIRDYLPEIARQLAALHSQRSVIWGTPWRLDNPMEDPRAYWAIRIKKFRNRISPATSELTEPQIERGIGQLETRLRSLPLTWPSLVHGDVNAGHIFLGPDGKLTWIDFGTAHYGLPEQDLADVRGKLFEGGDFTEFLKIYAKCLRDDRPVDSEAIKTFAILALWERLNSRVQRQIHRRERNGGAPGPSTAFKKLAEDQRRVEYQLARLIAMG